MIFYLHGFRSSPQSAKARQLQAHLQARGQAERFWCEQLAPSPRAAIAQVERQIAAARQKGMDKGMASLSVVGSSLGGYYATYLAERHDLRAVLVNPAVVAHLSLAEYVGEQSNLHTGAIFDFRAEYLDELRALEVPRLRRPENFLLLVETGDELLDYRQAVAKYAGARQIVLEGGDHGFSRWTEYLDTVLDFTGLAA